MAQFQPNPYLLPMIFLIVTGQPPVEAWAQPLSPALQQAQTAMEEGRYVDAEQLLNQIITRSPNSAEAHYQLGVSLHQQYRLREAITAYQKAIQIDAQYDAPYINLGLAWIEGQRPEKAIAVFRQVLARPDREASPASNHTLAHYNLAIIYKRQGNWENALTETQAALSISPEFEIARELLQTLQEQQETGD